MSQSIDILQQRMTQPYNLPILLIGAGFSIGAMNGDNLPMTLGSKLVEELYDNVLKPRIHLIKDYDEDREEVEQALNAKNLRKLCQKLRDFNLLSERDSYLTNRMKDCHWDEKIDFEALATYPWPYIFTLNIDDLVENIYKKVNKELVIWTEMSKSYDETSDKTVLVKLHGDVAYGNNYIFDDRDYNNFISRSPRILTKFADEYVSRDMIVLGTQFQEDDLEIALDKLLNERCISTNFQYFFISPSPFARSIRNIIQGNDNFHYIKMDNKEFLINLRKWRISYDSQKRLLLSNSFSDWNKEIDESRSFKKDYELYYGRSPEAKDFLYAIDIPRRGERIDLRRKSYYLVENSFKNQLKESCNFLVTIHGEAYVGKTCLAMRLLSICVELGYQCFYTQATDGRSIEKLKEYLSKQESGGLYAVCLENAAGAYYIFPEILENLNRNITLIIISTSLEASHQTKKHHLQCMNNGWEDYYITERISYQVAEDILKKLQKENHLGNLQTGCTRSADVKRNIRNCKDFINMLWFAHNGRYFTTHFNEWYRRHKDERQIKMFNLLTFYASLGCLSFPITFLPDLAYILNIRNFSYEEFKISFSDFWVEKNSGVRLRYVRLFADIVNRQISQVDIIAWIKGLMTMLAKRTQERDHSQYNLVFETIAKIKIVEKYTSLDKYKILQLYEDVENECKHLSYYWIQRCIIYSQCERFEEASNAISNAEATRKHRTYQIIHAEAKNNMARGIWCIRNRENGGDIYFARGREQIYSLIEKKNKYMNAFAFSVHTYIDMSIKYYQLLNRDPDELEWCNMKNALWTLVEEIKFSDIIISGLVDIFVDYAKSLDRADDVRGMKRKLAQKGRRIVDSTDYEIDEIPS